MHKTKWFQLALIIFLGGMRCASGAEVEAIPLQEDRPPVAHTVIPAPQKRRLLKILRAEVAAFQHDWPVVRKMIDELSPQVKPGDPLYHRFQAVRKQLLNAQTSRLASQDDSAISVSDVPVNGVLAVGFPDQLFQQNRPFLVLLPLSGPYQAAGKAILSELKKVPGFQPQDVLDTALFSPKELIQLIQSYQPSWLLGPLRPSVAEQVLPGVANIPVLAFTNHCPAALTKCFALVPPYKRLSLQLFAQQRFPGPTLKLMASDFWQKLSPQTQSMLKRTVTHLHILAPLASQQVLARLFKLQVAQQRVQHLQKTLNHPIQAVLRPRKDIEYVVFAGSLDGAYQIRTLIDFWHLPVEVIWLPVEFVSPQRLHALLPAWPDTTALLLPFFASKDLKNEKIGIFHAIGKTARIVLSQPKTAVVTPLGILQYATEQYEYRMFIPWMELHYGRIELQQDNARE